MSKIHDEVLLAALESKAEVFTIGPPTLLIADLLACREALRTILSVADGDTINYAFGPGDLDAARACLPEYDG
jgi:hypothetical protein